MPLETATYVNQVVNTNPASGDQVSGADDHIRLLKAVLLTTFPNLSGVINCTPAELNQLHTGTRSLGLANGSLGTPVAYFDAEATLGLYRASAGHLGVAGHLDVSGNLAVVGQLTGNGAKEVGEFCMFPFIPGTLVMAKAGTATGTERYIELDGSSYLMSAFPTLGALLPNDTVHFTVPDLKTTGKFLRSRTVSVAVATAQSNQNAAHTHTFSATGAADSQGSHTHTATVTDPGHLHTYAKPSAFAVQSGGGGLGASLSTDNTSTATTGVTVANATTGAHTHSVTASGTTDSTGSAEARPEAYTVCMCIKT